MSSPQVTLELVWDDEVRKFVIQTCRQGGNLAFSAPSESLPSSPTFSKSQTPAAPEPASVLLFDLNTLRKKADEADQHMQVRQAIAQHRAYLTEIKSLRWPPSRAQDKKLFDLQAAIDPRIPIPICLGGRDHKPTSKNTRGEEDQDDSKTEWWVNKDQPYLAVSTAREWKAISANFYTHHPKAADGKKGTTKKNTFLHTLTDFYELCKPLAPKPTGRQARKIKRREKAKADKKNKTRASGASNTTIDSGSTAVDSTDDRTGASTGSCTETHDKGAPAVPKLVYVMGRLVICQPQARREGAPHWDWIQPTVFMAAVELDNKTSDNHVSKDGNKEGSSSSNDTDSTGGGPIWLIRDTRPGRSSDDDDLSELYSPGLSMRRLGAVWPRLQVEHVFGRARLADSIERLMGEDEKSMTLSEAGDNICDTMDEGCWDMVEIEVSRTWPGKR